jgi:tetratricopeptide (TPR) repeat protein
MLACCLTAAASAQIDPRTAMLEQAGFDALNAGQIDRAVAAFTDALTSDPKNAQLHLGMGVAAYLQQRDSDALRELTRAIEIEPQLADAHEFLGLTLHHQGDLFGAIRSYEDWLAAAPPSAGTKRAAETLARWRRELDLRDHMQETLGDHFTVSFEGPAESDLARSAVDSLERAYWRIGPLLGVYPVNAVPVILYTTDEFHDITRSPAWAAAAYDGTIRVPMRGALDRQAELDRVLAHEFTHALVHTLAPRAIPTWLNEGLAAALESDDLEWAHQATTAADAPIPLSALATSFERLNGRDATLAYAESALAVRQLLDTIGGAGVANLIRDLGEGVSFDAAFAHRAQQSFGDFSASLSR